MTKGELVINKKVIYTFIALIVIFFGLSLVVNPPPQTETISEVMQDAVLHNHNKVEVLGLKVNPAVISAYSVTAILLVLGVFIRFLVIPKFKIVPGSFQIILESIVGYFNNLAKTSSPVRNKFLGAYIFAAGIYIFCSTIFELFGVPVLTTTGATVSLPAPLSDLNNAIMLGVLSYLIIVSGAIAENGPKGILKGLKEFSLPLSMSFRLFGALLSGLLVNELIYHYMFLSYVLPVIVSVLFKLLHAVIQAYVLTMLTSLFYGEVTNKE